ncbi:lipid phosphate phosphatase LPPB [Acrasis kona]|uniref:Lipid phosphate phosphatase LPPB n=1 Tax=Acrasis kona TaxID=1008807 RepID=A0AAW2ZCV0_9EUKA
MKSLIDIDKRVSSYIFYHGSDIVQKNSKWRGALTKIWKLISLTNDGILWVAMFPGLVYYSREVHRLGYTKGNNSLYAVFKPNNVNFLYLCLFVDLCLIYTVKNTFKRVRPYGSVHMDQEKKNNRTILELDIGPDKFSFPSGHSSRAMVITGCAILLHHKSPNSVTANVSAALAVWCATIGISRVCLGRHYVTDVIAGLVLGAFDICVGSFICSKIPVKKYFLF